MKKNSFLQGAFIATASIILIKIIGALYVIPFFPLIGEKGGALYGYAYSIYSMFLNFSVAGIPFAISRITSEYSSLEFDYLKNKAYKIGRLIICLLGFFGFLILFFFSENIAYLIMGNISGGNTIEEVSFVIKVVSTALLIVPLLSVTRGYLQGQKYISVSSKSAVIEQVFRVVFLLLFSFLAIKVFKLELKYAIGFAVFSATIGALISYLFIYFKMKKNKKVFNQDATIKTEEKSIRNKTILKKILVFSIVFILIDLIKSSFSFVDLITVNKTLVSLGYSITESEAVMGVITTWGAKITALVYAVASGLIVSLVPNITSSYVLKNYEDVKHKINKSLQALLFLIIPMCIGISFLSEPIWVMLFGTTSSVGPIVLQYSIFIALAISLFSLSVTILNSLEYSKVIVFSMTVGLIFKFLLNNRLMILFNKLNIFAYYGVITATIIGFLACFIINMLFIRKYIKIGLKKSIVQTLKILLSSSIMIISLIVLKDYIHIEINSRLTGLLVATFYSIIGAIIYLYISMKTKSIYEIFGNNVFERVKEKLRRKKYAK